MNITNGKVSFTRSVKPADYEKKEATVELSFGPAEGEDKVTVEHLEAVSRLALEKALAMVGLKPAQTTIQAVASPTSPGSSGKEAAAAAMNAKEAAAPPKRGPGRPKNPPETLPNGAPADPSKGNGVDVAASAAARAAANAAAINAADVTDADVQGGGDDDILGAASVEITDKNIQEAITKKNGSLQAALRAAGGDPSEAPKKLRQLIAKFAGPVPKQSRDIPQPARVQFLGELEALA